MPKLTLTLNNYTTKDEALSDLLEGLRAKHARSTEAIAKIERRLGRGRSRGAQESRPVAEEQAPPRPNHISAEGRARIAAAQRRRWAKSKKAAARAAKEEALAAGG